MSLNLQLFTKDSNCNLLVSIEITHFTNFNGKNTYHCHLKDEQIKLVTALTLNNIPFSVEFSSFFIDDTKINIRLDSNK